MKKVVIYARVSTVEQNTDSQINTIETYCKNNNFQVVEKFTDIITGASKAVEREGFNSLNYFLSINQDVKDLIVFEYSRLGRSFIDTYSIIEDFSNKGINIYFLKENLNTLNSNADDKLRLNLLSSIAEYERSQIKERTKRGRLFAIQKMGAPSGSLVQYGYKKQNNMIVVDDSEAEVIRTIFKLYLEKNYSTTDIANYLNSNNIATKYKKMVENGNVNPKDKRLQKNEFAWSDGSVARLMKKKILIGLREYKGLDLPYNENLQIIDNEIFEKAVNKLGNQKKVSPNALKFENVLKGCIKCSCGFNYIMHKGNTGNAHHYKCNDNKCSAPNVDIDLLNNVVYFYLQSAQRNDVKIKEKIAELQEKINSLKAVNEQIRARIEANEQKLMQLYDDKLNQRISGKIFDKFNLDLNTENQKNTEEIEKNQAVIEGYQTEIDNYKNSEDKNYSNPEIFKKHIRNIIKEIKIKRIEKTEELKAIFPAVRHSSILHVQINAETFGYFECIVNINHNYFLSIIQGKGDFTPYTTTVEIVMNEDTGLAEEKEHLTPNFIKVQIPEKITI